MPDESVGSLKRSIPPGLPGQDSRGAMPSYSHVVEDPSSGLIFTAGQVGIDEHGNLAAEDVVGQFRECLRHFDFILEDRGLDRSSVMKTTIYVTDVASFYADGGMDLYKSYFSEFPPVATLVGVTALARPEFKIEVEIVLSRAGRQPGPQVRPATPSDRTVS